MPTYIDKKGCFCVRDFGHKKEKKSPNEEVEDLCSCGVEVIDILGRNKNKKCSLCGRNKPEQDLT